MPIVRLIILATLVGLVFFLWRRFRSIGKRPDKPIDYAATVQCRRCGVHVPKNEAISKDGHYYCSAEHASED